MDQDQPRLTRRRLLQLGIALPLPAVLAACDDGDDPTPAQTEGPYFTPNSPDRASLLEAGMAGDRLTVAGTVLATDRLRGHQFTDADGRFRLETIVPGLYPGRTRHIHVKVQAPDRPVLTTQLYFPGEPANAADGIFREELLLDMPGDRQGSFIFVLQV